jgi:hypothetical protein
MEELLAGLEPSFSADGNTAYDLAPVLVIVEDPNPGREVIQAPYEGELPMMLAAASTNIIYLNNGQSDWLNAPCAAFPPGAQTALSYAAALWANAVNSPVPINIEACWADIGGSTLGYARSVTMHINWTGAPRANTWYAAALANALSGQDRESSKPEIQISFNQNSNWYFGTNANPPGNAYDLATVALHEIAHGLNFFGSAQVINSIGQFGFGDNNYPVIYDHFLEDSGGGKLINYANPSSALAGLLTGNSLWLRGDHSFAANGGSRVKMYAPSPFVLGSSYAHLDYATYSNTINNLMVYSINQGTAIHKSGPVTQGLLRDLGWDILPQSSAPPTNPTSLGSPSHQTGVPYDGTQNVVIEWNEDAQAASDSSLAGYSILWDQNPHGVPDTLVDLPPDTITVTRELALGEWYFHLRACDVHEHCAEGMHLGPFIKVDPFPPNPLTPEMGASPENRRPFFEWSPVEGATSYVLQVSRYSNFSTKALKITTGSTYYQPASDLPRGRVLYWRVRARGEFGRSAWSEVFSFNSPATPSTPKLRSPAKGALVRDPRPLLRWYASSMMTGSVFGYYQVQLARDAGFSDLVYEDAQVEGQYQTSFTPGEDLAPLTRYYWRVRALNGQGQYSAWSAVWNFRQAIPPPDLIAPAEGVTTADRSPQFEWAAVDGAASYTIQVSRYASFSTRIFAATVYDGTSFTSSKALPAGRTLYWRVRTNHAEYGPGKWSDLGSFSTPSS